MYQGFELSASECLFGEVQIEFLMEVCGVKSRSGFAFGIRCVAGEMCGETAAFAWYLIEF